MSKEFNFEDQALPLLLSPQSVIKSAINPILVMPVYVSWFNHSRINMMLNGCDNHDELVDAVWEAPGFGCGQMFDFKNFFQDPSLLDKEVPKLQKEMGRDITPVVNLYLEVFENIACEYTNNDPHVLDAITNSESFRSLGERLSHAQTFVDAQTPDLFMGYVFSYFETEPMGVFTVRPEDMMDAIDKVSRQFGEE